MNTECATNDFQNMHHIKCLSWSSIIAGALVGVGLSFLFNLFGVAIGLTAFTTSPEGMTTLAVGGFVGLVIATIVAMYLCGWVAGYLAKPHGNGNHSVLTGELYGFLAWCVSLLLAVILATHLTQFVSHYTSALTSEASPINIAAENASPARTSREPIAIMNTEHATNTAGMLTFSTFTLFFIGALASCFGGYCGLACAKKSCSNRDKIMK